MPAKKIQDESEVKRWFREGRTYGWMVEQYREKYNLEVGRTMFSQFRYRQGLDRRIARDDDLIPWAVKPEHRYAWPINMLRAEARRRTGVELSEMLTERVDAWIRGMERDGTVLHYEGDTEQGWFYVLRREGVDLDLIREPERKTTNRRRSD